MNDFNPDQYRATLRERFGLKPALSMHRKVGYTDPATSSVSQNSSPVIADFGTDGGGEAADPLVAPVDAAPTQAVGGAQEEVNPEVDQAQLALAIALLVTLLDSVDEQTRSSNDEFSSNMWRSLRNYIWKNRNKIAKKMIDDAQ